MLVILLVASSQLVTNGTPISQDLSAALMKAAPPSPVAANAADVQKSSIINNILNYDFKKV